MQAFGDVAIAAVNNSARS